MMKKMKLMYLKNTDHAQAREEGNVIGGPVGASLVCIYNLNKSFLSLWNYDS